MKNFKDAMAHRAGYDVLLWTITGRLRTGVAFDDSPIPSGKYPL
jgi:hypothetical protein